MLEPISAFAVGHFASKAVDKCEKAFRLNVLERWKRRRAQEFFEQFCLEAEVASPEAMEQHLKRLFEDEFASELMFDAYRSVCFTKSKVFGPRIIAILTANLVRERREATPDEEMIGLAAETLTDEEIRECAKSWYHYHALALNPKHPDCKIGGPDENGIIWVIEFDELYSTPTELEETVGRWALKGTFGFISQNVTHDIQLKFDSSPDSWSVDAGSLRQAKSAKHTLYLSPAYKQFAEIVRRVDVEGQETSPE